MGAVDGILAIIDRANGAHTLPVLWLFSALAITTVLVLALAPPHANVACLLLRTLPGDSVITWLACSALWNLARPAATRALIPPRMFTVLKKLLKSHRDQKEIVQCALGALSNVAISEKFQRIMCRPAFVKLMVESWDAFREEKTVATAATGCVANMAIDENAEDMLIEAGVLERLVRASRKNISSVDINRNVSAALSNLCNCTMFKNSIVDCQGVEVIYKLAAQTENNDVRQLLFNVLEAMDLSIEKPTTSLHLAARAGKVRVCTTILQENPDALDVTNGDGYTALDEAVFHRRRSCAHLLSAVGGHCARELHSDVLDTSDDWSEGSDIRTGRVCYGEIKVSYIKSISRSMNGLPISLCQEIVHNISGVDRYLGAKERENEVYLQERKRKSQLYF